MDGLKLKVLNRTSDHPEAADLCSCVANAFDAVEKGYLRQLVMAIMSDPNKEDTVIETYSFNFEYAEHTEGASGDGSGGFRGPHVNLSFTNGRGKGAVETHIADKDDIYQQTRLLLHKIKLVDMIFFSDG